MGCSTSVTADPLSFITVSPSWCPLACTSKVSKPSMAPGSSFLKLQSCPNRGSPLLSACASFYTSLNRASSVRKPENCCLAVDTGSHNEPRSAESSVSTAVLTVSSLGLPSPQTYPGGLADHCRPLSPIPGRLAGHCHLFRHIRVWLVTQFAQQSFRAGIFVFDNSILYLQKLHY